MDEVAGEVVGGTTEPLLDQARRIAEEPGHPARGVHLAFGRCMAKDEGQAMLAAGLYDRHVRIRDAEDAEHHERGQLPGEIAHQIGASRGEAFVEKAVHERPDERLHRCNALRGEAYIRQAPEPRMCGWIDVGKRWHRVIVALFQLLHGGRAKRHEGRGGIASTEQRRSAEDMSNVGVARDDPMIDRRRVEDRRRLACSR